MQGPQTTEFSNIVRGLINKSLFTKRQVEIITSILDDTRQAPPISRGAYHRQVGQVRAKTEAVMYSVILLHVMGIVSTKSLMSIPVISEQISVIFDSDIDEMHGQQVLDVIEKAIKASIEL